MSRYHIAPVAREDLKEIYNYIKQHSPRAAGALRSTFFDHFRLLARQPMMGESRSDLAANVRLLTAGNYVILFRPVQHGVEIVRVVHSARDLQAICRRTT